MLMLAAAAQSPLALRNQVCFPIYAAARLMVQAYAPLLDAIGLTYPQYLVLLVLWERDGQSVQALGGALYLDSGTLTPLLKRLEAAGLIERRQSRDDERVTESWLTPRGHALRRRAQRIPLELFQRLETPPAELFGLKKRIEALIHRLKLLGHQGDNDATEPQQQEQRQRAGRRRRSRA
jgi:DNA-binding MarR family transcriptional regulator